MEKSGRRRRFLVISISDEDNPAIPLLLKEAKILAEAGKYNDAISKLKLCLGIMNDARDFKGAADLHLLILDYEKLKMELEAKSHDARELSAKPEREATPAPVPAPTKSAPATRRPVAVPVTMDSTMADWDAGRDALKLGESFKAVQKFLSVKRSLKKLKADPSLLEKIDSDIRIAKGEGAGNLSSTSHFNKTVDSSSSSSSSSFSRIPAASSVTPAFSSQSSMQKPSSPKPASVMGTSTDNLFSLMRQAQEAKQAGDYEAALSAFNRAFKIANEAQKRSIQKQLSRIKQLVLLKDKVTSDSSSTFFDVVDGGNGSHPGPSGASIPGSFDDVAIEKMDYDSREKVEKRREAENLIVQAENTENVAEAIEKLQDAAHLLLVTGTRLDRVEWVYEKINQVKKQRYVKKEGLFGSVTFRPSQLRNYAFQQIDKAKQEARYGKFKDSIEMYKKSIKALLKAGWSNDQVNYIIQDMVEIRKKLDAVEKEEERLQDIFDSVVVILLDEMDSFRENGVVVLSGADTGSIDENIHRPGREKTLLEKQLEKLRAEQAEKAGMQEKMFDLLEEAKFKIDLGRFKEAVGLYEEALKIMDSLGGWDNQKRIVLDEIDNLYILIGRQNEIAELERDINAGDDKGISYIAEKTFLIKKAALLNQENLKERLIKKKINDEKIKSVFDFLIPVANKLKKEGRLQDALVEFKEAMKMLDEAGWKDQTQALLDEIHVIEKMLEGQSTVDLAIGIDEKREIRKEIFEIIIPEAKQAVLELNFKKAKGLYNLAIDKLNEIGWENQVQPLHDEIAKIEGKLSEIEQEGEAVAPIDRAVTANELIDLGMQFLTKDLKEYAVMQFKKAINLLEELGDTKTVDELTRQVKKIELEIRLDESRRILFKRRGKEL
ncbi:MAG: hypothetical protein ACTSUE_04275 [Promethearchaeota archaeon]